MWEQIFLITCNTYFVCNSVFVVNPSLNSHNDTDTGLGRGGFGRGFRGRGGIRPGLHRAEFLPAEMTMAVPWMGKFHHNLLEYAATLKVDENFTQLQLSTCCRD